MTIHSYHPDSHTRGLADGCPRCEEHAQRPLDGLDCENLGVLARRLALGWSPRSHNEETAMQALFDAILETHQPGDQA